MRRIIPSCAVSKIRETFPEADGIYTSYKGNDAIASEIICAMEWVKITEEPDDETS